MARETSETAEETLALNQLGFVAERLGALEDAEDHYRRALQLQQATGRGVGAAVLHANLAGVALARGDLDEAERWARKAVEVSSPVDEPDFAGAAHRRLGEVELARGRLGEGAGALAIAATLFERAGLPIEEARTRLRLGRARNDSGDPREAVLELSRAQRLFQAAGDPARGDVVAALRELVRAYEALGQPRNALAFRERAIEHARLATDVSLRLQLLEEGIESAAALGRDDLARAWRLERAGVASAR